jgi:hypothetical protein
MKMAGGAGNPKQAAMAKTDETNGARYFLLLP